MAVRLIPYSVYDVPAMEHWLEEMSRKGLHLDWMYGHYATFRRGEPRECRYRLEPWGKDTPRLDDEMLALYETAGWEYVQRILGEEFHVWRSVRPDARELHDDPIVQSFGFERGMKRTRWGMLLYMFLLAAAALCFSGVWRFWERAVRDMPVEMLRPLIVCLWIAGLGLMDCLAVNRVIKSLRLGLWPTRRKRAFPYRRVLFYGVVVAIALWIALEMHILL